MQLRDVMTTDVQDIPADATLMQAAAKMKSLDVGAIPVCDEDDRVIGMITDRHASCLRPNASRIFSAYGEVG